MQLIEWGFFILKVSSPGVMPPTPSLGEDTRVCPCQQCRQVSTPITHICSILSNRDTPTKAIPSRDILSSTKAIHNNNSIHSRDTLVTTHPTSNKTSGDRGRGMRLDSMMIGCSCASDYNVYTDKCDMLVIF